MTTVWSSVMLVKLKTTVGLQSYMASVKPRYYAGKLFQVCMVTLVPGCVIRLLLYYSHIMFLCV